MPKRGPRLGIDGHLFTLKSIRHYRPPLCHSRLNTSKITSREPIATEVVLVFRPVCSLVKMDHVFMSGC
jgi:hypothetical protein